MGIFYKDCPHCAATHAAAADLCGCGYVFSGEKLEEPDLAPELAAQEEKLYEAYLAARLEQALLEARDARRMADVDPQNHQKAQIALEKANAIAVAQADFDTQARKTAEATKMAEIAKTARAARHKSTGNMAKVVSLHGITSATQKHHGSAHQGEKPGKKPAAYAKPTRNKKTSQAEQRKSQAKQVEAAKRLAEQARLQAEQAKHQAEQTEDARRRAKRAEAARLQEAQQREVERSKRLAEQAQQAKQARLDREEQAKRQAEQAEDARRRTRLAEAVRLQEDQAEAAKQARLQAEAALATRTYLSAQATKAEQAMKAIQAAKIHERTAAAKEPGAAFKTAQAARATQIMRPDTQECPNCTADVPQDAGRCGCGYHFSSGENEMPRLSLSPAEQSELLRHVAFETHSKHR